MTFKGFKAMAFGKAWDAHPQQIIVDILQNDIINFYN